MLSDSVLPKQDGLIPSTKILNEYFDPSVRKIVLEKWSHVKTSFKPLDLRNDFNVRLNGGFPVMQDIINFLHALHKRQRYAYKIDIGFGILLEHKTSKELLYRYPSVNNSCVLENVVPRNVRPNPIEIHSRRDLNERVCKHLEKFDLFEVSIKLRNSMQILIVIGLWH